jgi:hypothetical protein
MQWLGVFRPPIVQEPAMKTLRQILARWTAPRASATQQSATRPFTPQVLDEKATRHVGGGGGSATPTTLPGKGW